MISIASSPVSYTHLDVYKRQAFAEERAKLPAEHRDDRPVMIHAQTVRPDQLERMAPLGMIPSFFVAHVYYWGDVHLTNLGRQRAERISPVKSAEKLDMVYRCV